ncbi:MAG: hypothetical protein ACKPBV_16960 [Sphaerospermopsis kisseleviana]
MIDYVYSLPAHEKPQVLIDQIQNLNKFNKNFSVLIVIHLSQRFNLTTEEIESISIQPNVLLNPERLITGFMDGSLYEAHLSNILLLYDKQIQFGHLVFIASNMMFVRQMKNITSDFIGSSHDAITHKGWFQAWMAVRDKNINKFHLYGCQIEGLFVSKKLLDKMLPYLKSISYKELFIDPASLKRNTFYVKLIRQLRKYRFRKWVKTNYLLKPIRYFTFSQFPFARIAYATEEVYFSTIARLFETEFVFSGKEISFQDWKNSNVVTVDSINWLRSDQNKDYVCTKRVDRIYDDTIRVYIRNLSGDV